MPELPPLALPPLELLLPEELEELLEFEVLEFTVFELEEFEFEEFEPELLEEELFEPDALVAPPEPVPTFKEEEPLEARRRLGTAGRFGAAGTELLRKGPGAPPPAKFDEDELPPA